MDAENPRAVVGDNAPPAPTPYEVSVEEIESLWIEAENFLDGEPITSPGAGRRRRQAARHGAAGFSYC